MCIRDSINRTIHAHVLGKEYIRMNPEVAVDSFKNTYINNYRKDVNEFYQEDIKNGTPKDVYKRQREGSQDKVSSVKPGAPGKNQCQGGPIYSKRGTG